MLLMKIVNVFITAKGNVIISESMLLHPIL